MNYGNGRSLGILYDNRLRPWQWLVDGVLGTQYYYGYFGENTGRVTYAHDYNDYRSDRSYEYDQVGRLIKSETGDDARIHIGESVSGFGAGSYHQQNSFDVWGNLTSRSGDGGWLPNYNMNYVNNQMQVGRTYDAAGNFVDDGWGQHFQYDAASRQTSDGVHVGQAFDGDGLRARKVDYNVTTFYLRSSILGGQVVSELDANGNWQRGYVSGGNEMIAIQSNSEGIRWVHADPITKKQRLTDSAGVTQSVIDVDPWGAETAWEWNQSSQSHRYTSYERDGNGGDEAQARHYQAVWSRFDQPDPYDGSYDLTNPQSFNRYSYTQNDPVNFVDPSGLNLAAGGGGGSCWVTWSATAWYQGNTYLGMSDFKFTGMSCTGSGSVAGDGDHESAHSEPQKTRHNQQQKPSCDAQLTGDTNIDLLARYIHGEADNPVNVNEMNGIGQVFLNRFDANITYFGGQDWAAVLSRGSTADDGGGNAPFRAAGSAASISKMSQADCDHYKAAQAASQFVIGLHRNGQPGVLGADYLWFRHNIDQQGSLQVGTLFLYNFDPQNNAATGVDVIAGKWGGRRRHR
jgi:RHS repeat-associated protein